MSRSNKSIIIIGAGLAGFSAAARLIENKFLNIILLEAENRYGGRIHSVPYSDGKIDMGAQWVHGEEKNAIYEAAHTVYQFGSTGFDDVDQTFLMSNGTLPKQKDCRKLVELAYSIFKRFEDDMENFDGSLGEFFLKHFNDLLNGPKYQGIDPKLIVLFKDHIHRETNGYFASSSWFDISAKLNAQTDETEGNQHLTWKKDGFIKFFDLITVCFLINFCYKIISNL